MKTVLFVVVYFFLIISSVFAQDETYTSSNKSTKVSFNRSNGISNFSVEMRGKIEVTDDDNDLNPFLQKL